MTDSSEQNKGFTFYTIFTQFLLEVIVFIGGSVALGLYLDKKCNTKCLFLLIFVFVFAFVPIYNLVKRMRIKDEKKN